MKCHWCNEETQNKPDGRYLDTFGNVVAICDECEKASKEADDYLERLRIGNKGQAEKLQAERLNPEDGNTVCDSLNRENK